MDANHLNQGVSNIFDHSAKKPRNLNFKDGGVPGVDAKGAAKDPILVMAAHPAPSSTPPPMVLPQLHVQAAASNEQGQGSRPRYNSLQPHELPATRSPGSSWITTSTCGEKELF